MIRSSNIENAMQKSTNRWPVKTLRKAVLVLLLISTNLLGWSGCANGPKLVVISSDELETVVLRGQSFTAPVDGRFLSESRYLQFRRAVADRIQDLTPKP